MKEYLNEKKEIYRQGRKEGRKKTKNEVRKTEKKG